MQPHQFKLEDYNRVLFHDDIGTKQDGKDSFIAYRKSSGAELVSGSWKEVSSLLHKAVKKAGKTSHLNKLFNPLTHSERPSLLGTIINTNA